MNGLPYLKFSYRPWACASSASMQSYAESMLGPLAELIIYFLVRREFPQFSRQTLGERAWDAAVFNGYFVCVRTMRSEDVNVCVFVWADLETIERVLRRALQRAQCVFVSRRTNAKVWVHEIVKSQVKFYIRLLVMMWALNNFRYLIGRQRSHWMQQCWLKIF